MTVPRSETQPQLDDQASGSRADATAASEPVPLEISGATEHEESSEFAVLVRGDLQPASTVEDVDGRTTVTAIETNATLLAGSLDGASAAFTVNGDLLGVTVDDPAPSIAFDGTPVDVDCWPTVHEAIGRGAYQEPVHTPFPESGEMGKPLGDPLDPKEYVVTIEAGDGSGSYAFDVEGAIVDQPSSATVSGDGASVSGEISAEAEVRIDVRGALTGIEVGDGLEFSVRARN